MSEEQVAEVSEEVAPSDAQQDWRSQIPEDIAGHRSLEHIQDVGALAKSYVNAQQMIGADKLAIPGKYATDEDWAEVDRRLGRPDTPEGYQLENNLPEGFEPDESALQGFQQAAHEIGLRPGQAQKLLDWYNNEMGQSASMEEGQYEAIQAQTEADFRREYGAAYEDNIENVSGLIAEFGNDEMTEMMLADGTRLGDNPDFIRMNVAISNFINEKIGEDTLEGVKASNAMVPNDIKAEIAAIDANPAYFDKRHPQQPYLVQERLRLQTMLNDTTG